MKYIAWFVLSIIAAASYMALVVAVGREAERIPHRLKHLFKKQRVIALPVAKTSGGEILLVAAVCVECEKVCGIRYVGSMSAEEIDALEWMAT